MKLFLKTPTFPSLILTGAIALTFMNQFWKVVYDTTLPFAEESFAKIAKPILNKVFLSVPYDQLFPLMPTVPERA